MSDPNAVIASFQEVINGYEQKLQAADAALADLTQRLQQISELAHQEAEQPAEAPYEPPA